VIFRAVVQQLTTFKLVKASHGPSAIAELLIAFKVIDCKYCKVGGGGGPASTINFFDSNVQELTYLCYLLVHVLCHL